MSSGLVDSCPKLENKMTITIAVANKIKVILWRSVSPIIAIACMEKINTNIRNVVADVLERNLMFCIPESDRLEAVKSNAKLERVMKTVFETKESSSESSIHHCCVMKR